MVVVLGCNVIIISSFPLLPPPLPSYSSPQVGDEVLEINGNSTENMLHSDAATIVRHGGDMVRLIVRRLTDKVLT